MASAGPRPASGARTGATRAASRHPRRSAPSAKPRRSWRRSASAASTGGYVSPHAGRVLFGDHARQWMESWNNEATTHARDASIMRTHVIAQWGTWPLSKIDHLSVQTWITDLSRRLSPATVAECRRLTSAVLRSAVRNRLIAFNPLRGHQGAEAAATRHRRAGRRAGHLPAAAAARRARPLPRTRRQSAGGCGLRWGEAAGLCTDALDLDRGTLRVIRTVIEVGGHTSFKPYPKSTGRATHRAAARVAGAHPSRPPRPATRSAPAT